MYLARSVPCPTQQAYVHAWMKQALSRGPGCKSRQLALHDHHFYSKPLGMLHDMPWSSPRTKPKISHD